MEGTHPGTLHAPGPTVAARSRKTWPLLVLCVVVIVVAAGAGFWAGAYWTSHMPPPAPPKVVLGQELLIPRANYSNAEEGVGVGVSGYTDDQMQFVYEAPIPVDACLIDLLNGGEGIGYPWFESCASLQGATVQYNRTTGAMGFTIPSSSGGFAYYFLSPTRRSVNVTYDWWINSTAGTVALESPEHVVAVPPPWLENESLVSLSVDLPSGYDRVSVQGQSSSPVRVVIGNESAAYFDSGDPIASWNWNGSYQGPQVVQVTFRSTWPDLVNLSLTVLVYNS